MTRGASELLRELALLLRRHPPDDFHELAKLLRDSAFLSDLSLILDEVGSKWPRRVPRRAPRTPNLLDVVRAEDETKYALLKRAAEILSDKSVHVTLPHVIEAVESAGVHLEKGRSYRREEIVRAFTCAAAELSSSELNRVLERLGSPKSQSDLRSWSRIIVPKKETPGTD